MIEINNRTRTKIDLRMVRRVTEKFFTVNKIKKEISIAFVGDSVMRRHNLETRGQDKVTDILSFPGNEENFFGEIVIDYAQIKRQSKKYSQSVKEELVFILIHGLFHLLGYDDETEEKRLKMQKMGKDFINRYF